MENDTTVELEPVTLSPALERWRLRRAYLRALHIVLSLREKLRGRVLRGGVDDPVWLAVDHDDGNPVVLRLDPQSAEADLLQLPVAPELADEPSLEDIPYAAPEHVEWVVGMLKAACASCGHQPRHPSLAKSWAYFQERGPSWAAALAARAYNHGRLPSVL